MAADDAADLLEAGWIGEVFVHLGGPPLGVSRNAVTEPLGEGLGVEVSKPSLAFEELSDVSDDQLGVLGQSVQVVEVAALHALDNASELLGSDLRDWVGGEGNGVGEVWPDGELGPFLDGLDLLVGSQVKLDLARPCVEWSDVRDGWPVFSGEFELGKARVGPNFAQRLDEGGGSLLRGAVDHGEVQVGRVAVVGKVDEPDRGATLEDETSTVLRSGVVELGDNMGEDVVPLHDRSIDTVGVRSAG